MTNFFEVLELICLFMNVASLIVIGIGWLTCADYYYKLSTFADGLPLFMHSMFSICISIATVVIGLIVGSSIGSAPYVNIGYWSIVLIVITSIFLGNKIMVLRQYFASKRGRV